jgi:hypothetical protein
MGLYAFLLGLYMLAVGLVGLIAGEGTLGGWANVDLAADVFHLVVGATLLLSPHFLSYRLLKSVVGLSGVVLVVLGFAGFIAPTLGGLLSHGLTAIENLLHLVAGGVALAFAAFTSRRTTEKEFSQAA